MNEQVETIPLQPFRILVKFPTRSRPEQFLKTLESWIDRHDSGEDIEYLITADRDDESFTDEIVKQAERMSNNVIVVKGISTSKIDACNRDIKTYTSYFGSWDAIILVSDDMVCTLEGWDTVIKEQLEKHGNDKVLWFHDGSSQKVISTLSCMGREYFNKIGYLYHPSYKSFFCDNEHTEVARSKGALIELLDITIAKHNHPAWNKEIPTDALYQKANLDWDHDKKNFYSRQHANFPA